MKAKRQQRVQAAGLVAAALLASAAVLWLIGSFVLNAAWLAVAGTRVSDERARGYFGHLVGGPEQLPQSFEVLNAVKVGGRDSSWWYELRVSPEDVPAFKKRVVEGLGRRHGARWVVDDDLSAQSLGGAYPPGWWDADDLDDGDVVSAPQAWFMFSPRTGLVYVHEWDL